MESRFYKMEGKEANWLQKASNFLKNKFRVPRIANIAKKIK